MNHGDTFTSSNQTLVSINQNAVKGLKTNLTVVLKDKYDQSWNLNLAFQISSDGAAQIGIQTLELSSEMALAGFATHESYWFILIETSEGLSSYKKEPYSNKWNLECNYITYNRYKNLAVDENHFYIGKFGGIDKLLRSDCTNIYSYTPTSISHYSNQLNSISHNSSKGTFTLSQKGGVIHYRGGNDDFSHISSSLSGVFTYYTFPNFYADEIMLSSTINSTGNGYIFSL